MHRSLDTLQGRGLISEERSMANTDPFYDSALLPAARSLLSLLTSHDSTVALSLCSGKALIALHVLCRGDEKCQDCSV